MRYLVVTYDEHWEAIERALASVGFRLQQMPEIAWFEDDDTPVFCPALTGPPPRAAQPRSGVSGHSGTPEAPRGAESAGEER